MLNTDWIIQLESVGLVALAGLLGGAIGLEREWAGKAAGLRTHIFVCAAAALFMALTQSLIAALPTDAGATAAQPDPIRAMQSVVVGISFLGAGTIIRQGQERIEGLTTAATILLVAGIGIAVAVGQILTAVAVTALTLFVLIGLGQIEQHMRKRPRS
ncbi:MAG: MgtC/SapB family protein [Phycisphaeraceae bacterium]